MLSTALIVICSYSNVVGIVEGTQILVHNVHVMGLKGFCCQAGENRRVAE